MITIIAAMDEDHGIGKDNDLPWTCPEDMAFFKKTTMGHTVVMGRKTWDSIGRPLLGRRNVVISRDPDFKPEGVEVANDLVLALMGLRAQALPTMTEVFVMGGAEIYKQALPYADRILLTEVPGKYGCDTFFPDFDPGDWSWVAYTHKHPNAPTFNTYTRIHTE